MVFDRRATVTHGTTIDWDRDFASTERIGVLKVSKNKQSRQGRSPGRQWTARGGRDLVHGGWSAPERRRSLQPGDKTIRFIPSEN